MIETIFEIIFEALKVLGPIYEIIFEIIKKVGLIYEIIGYIDIRVIIEEMIMWLIVLLGISPFIIILSGTIYIIVKAVCAIKTTETKMDLYKNERN